MKTKIVNSIVKVICLAFCMLIIIPFVNAGDTYKARLSVDYKSIMNDRSFLAVNVKYKGDEGYQPATDLNLRVYEQISEDSLAFKGECVTNEEGNAEFDVQIADNLKDSLIKFEYVVKIENSDMFEDADKSVKFQLSKLIAEAVVVDSVNYISAHLYDAKGDPIEGEDLKLVLKRLFAPLTLGEETTDEDGNVMIALTDTMPGIDGNLNFEIILDAKKYGIVKNAFEAPIGKVIVDKSTFNERTMWSPPNKTPIFLWIFPNLIILGIWIVIGLLVFNLIKIYKS